MKVHTTLVKSRLFHSTHRFPNRMFYSSTHYLMKMHQTISLSAAPMLSVLKAEKNMSPEELAENGLNESLTHVDFMIGSEKMNIDGIKQDGTSEPVFRNGDWAF
ncbi:aminopeptidase [Peribacillus frigoritolerans]|nr:aminopeptidase [Peribacillus frigoritolerans]